MTQLVLKVLVVAEVTTQGTFGSASLTGGGGGRASLEQSGQGALLSPGWLPSTASASSCPRWGLAFVVRLLHRYYPVVRLLGGVHVGRTAIAFTHRSAFVADRHRRGLPVLVQKVS